MTQRRVVITGLGAVTPIGLTADETWRSAKDGVCGIGEITLYDTSNQKVKIAGEVKNFQPENYIDKREVRKLDRFTQLAIAAADQAFRDSGVVTEQENSYRCAVIVSSGIGGLGTIADEHARGEQKGFDRVSPYFIPMSIANMGAAHIAIRCGFHGMVTCPVTACAGGTNAVGDGMRLIRGGHADVAICGGAESSITPLGIGGFTSMKALSDSNDPNRASIPFDKERDGFVMGEGAAMLVLESLEHAQARGAKIYAEVIGYGATCDAYHITAPDPDGTAAKECMRQAIEDGGIAPEDVDYINAHGTSTPLNDKSETAAVKAVFGEYAKRLMISSTKSMMGHLLGASGAVEALLTALALKEGFVPPTVNYRVPDEECDLDVVPNTGRKANLRYALSNSLGFGGHNASLILKRWEEE